MTDTLPPPLVVRTELAGALLGLDRQAAYREARKGVLPTLPGFGRRKVPLVELEKIVGRAITRADIAAAEAWLTPERTDYLRYQRGYSAAKRGRGRPKSGPATAGA